MTTFVLLSKVSAESLKRVKNLAEMDRAFERKLAEQCPGVKRVASFALLGAYDFLHIFEAPDAVTAAKVALISNEFGTGSTQTLTAIPFEQFSKAVEEIS
ncbi:MAG: GYD domain-containing protein [Chloroflexi bacterium]|nr:GYD domain-containing protein [Chloroflexota bacterium]